MIIVSAVLYTTHDIDKNKVVTKATHECAKTVRNGPLINWRVRRIRNLITIGVAFQAGKQSLDF